MQNEKQLKSFSKDDGVVSTKLQSKTRKAFLKADSIEANKLDIDRQKKILGGSFFIG